MSPQEILQVALKAFAGIDEEAFKLSQSYWHERQYKKGEFYNEYKNVCKHFGFILDGIFRTLYQRNGGREECLFLFGPADCGSL